MSENSLKCRNKFVNKVVDKLNGLKNDIELLYKVDKKISRKIFKNINNQSGGADHELTIAANKAQIGILRKNTELQNQATEYTQHQQGILDKYMMEIQRLHSTRDSSSEQLRKLEELVSKFKEVISNMIHNIKSMKIDYNTDLKLPNIQNEDDDSSAQANIKKIVEDPFETWDEDTRVQVMAIVNNNREWKNLNDNEKKIFNDNEIYFRTIVEY